MTSTTTINPKVREAGADGGRWRTEGGVNYIIDGQIFN